MPDSSADDKRFENFLNFLYPLCGGGHFTADGGYAPLYARLHLAYAVAG